MSADLLFTNMRSFVACCAITDAGQEWMRDNIQGYQGAPLCYIEPRYLADIVLGARADGLICEATENVPSNRPNAANEIEGAP